MNQEATQRILVAHHNPERRLELEDLLRSIGHSVVATVGTRHELIAAVDRTEVNVIVSSLRLADGDGIEALITASQDDPIPSVIVTPRTEQEAVLHALDDHVMAYLVEPVTANDLRPTIQLVVNRFEQFKELRQEVDDLRAALAARKVIERAKGLLMQRDAIDENAAHRLLQQLANDRRKKLIEIAHAVLAGEQITRRAGG